MACTRVFSLVIVKLYLTFFNLALAYFRVIFAKVNSKRELGWQNKFPSGALLGRLCVRAHGVGVPFSP